MGSWTDDVWDKHIESMWPDYVIATKYNTTVLQLFNPQKKSQSDRTLQLVLSFQSSSHILN